MKIKAQQFELTGADEVFSLRGEVATVAEKPVVKAKDTTADLFADAAEIERGRKAFSLELR